MGKIYFFLIVMVACHPQNKGASLKSQKQLEKVAESFPNTENQLLKVGEPYPQMAVEDADRFFSLWDEKWTTENVVSIDKELETVIKAIDRAGQNVRLVASSTSDAVKRRIQILTPILSSFIPDKNDYYFSKIILPGHFALGVEFDGKMFENGQFKSKKSCKFVAGIPCLLSLEASYSLIKDMNSDIVSNKHCGTLGCRVAGMWLYEIEVKKTSSGLKFRFPKSIGHTSFAELFESALGSPIIFEVSKKTTKAAKYIGIDDSDNLIWSADNTKIAAIQEFNLRLNKCQKAD